MDGERSDLLGEIKPASERRAVRLGGRTLAVLYILLCLVPVILAGTRQAAPLVLVEAVAAALGLAGLAAMAIQFVTSGRFESVSGHLGIDRIMAFHKVAARWVLLALLLHPVLYVVPTWVADPDLGTERLVAYLSNPHYRSGVVAYAALVLLVVTSVLAGRLPWRYEIWRGSHIVLAIVAVGGGLHHALTAGRFSVVAPVEWFWWAVAAAVGLVVATLYGWRWLKLHRSRWRLASIRPVADRLWELDIQPEPGNQGLPYRAGQFVWMTVGKRRFPLLDHPFSIADSPRRPGISLIVKEAGDFTGRIGSLPPGTAIGVDGPYGDFVLDGREADSILLLAGGVGIAPVMGLLRDMVARRETRPVRLGYAAGQPSNVACVDEIVAARSDLDLQVMLISEADAPGWTGLLGRFDRDRLEALLAGLDRSRTLALLCGPGPMVAIISDTLHDLGLPSRNIVYERFDYGAGLASREDRRRSRTYTGIGAVLLACVAALAVALQ